MSTTSHPIPPDLFSLALKDLPLETVYAKAAELQNSISHLLDSNIQMKPFADDGDEVCREAITENDCVIARMEERIRLCRDEVEGRGMRWSAHGGNTETVGGEDESKVLTNGLTNGDGEHVRQSGRLTDEELRRQLEAQMGAAGEDDEDEGVHL